MNANVQSDLSSVGGITSRPDRHSNVLLHLRSLVARLGDAWFELLLAAALTATYYYLVKGYAAGVEGNSTNYWVFSACSKWDFHLDKLYAAWRGRLGGLFLSGGLFDLLVRNNGINPGAYGVAFGLYHAGWLFLIFMLTALSTPLSKWVNLGIFAGLVYNTTPITGQYFYPCDLPAAFFFTMAVLLYRYKRMELAIAVICLGSFFRETVLVATVLSLFVSERKWLVRILFFLVPVAFYVLLKRFSVRALGVDAAVFSMGDATRFSDLFRLGTMGANLNKIFTPTLNHFVFTNGGSLVAVLLLCWRRKFFPYTLVIGLFFLGNFVYANFDEYRTFVQVLPLSWLLLAERFGLSTRNSESREALSCRGDESVGLTPMVPSRRFNAYLSRDQKATVFAYLTCIPIVILVLASGVAIAEARGSEHMSKMLGLLERRASSGQPEAEAELGMRLLNGEGFPRDPARAVRYLTSAAQNGNANAQAELGFLYGTGQVLPKDLNESFSWLSKAAGQGNEEAQFGIGCLYEKGLGVEKNPSEAVVWYERAAEAGNARAEVALGLLLCLGRHEYKEGTKWLSKAAGEGATDAQKALGGFCLSANGSTPDLVQGLMWFRLAARKGDQEANESAVYCSHQMTQGQVETADALVTQYLKEHPKCW